MGLIILLNVALSDFPAISIHHQTLSSADILAGITYLMRDFAQRELKHYVIGAMLLAALCSYWLASPLVAVASVTAFSVGELVDWSIFSFTKKTLSARLLISSCVAIPLDTIVFLSMMHQFNLVGCLVMNMSKWLGVFLVWSYWYSRSHRHKLPVAS